jgi:FkbM family methyltransferase
MIPGKIYCIDPSPNNIRFVERLVKANCVPNVKPMEMVLGDIPDSEIYRSGAASVDHATFLPKRNSKKDVAVKSTTLDRLHELGIVDHLGLLHIDVEGFEPRVIAGAKAVIQKFAPTIVTEAHGDHMTIPGYQSYRLGESCGTIPGCRNTVHIPEAQMTEWLEKTILSEFKIEHHTKAS